MPTGISTNRSSVSLPSEVSREILSIAKGDSAVMRLARKTTLPGGGADIPVFTSDPEAEWVEETGEKPVSNPGLGTKKLQGYTLAVIVPFSKQFLRDMGALYDECIARLPGALALKFDQTVIGAAQKPGENFDNLASATAQALVSDSRTVYQALVDARIDIADAGYMMNGFAFSPAGTGILLGTTDQSGRPLFLQSPEDGSIGRVLGATAIETRGMYVEGEAGEGTAAGTPAIVGVAGDWTQAVWGAINGVELSFSDQATLKIGSDFVNLWQHNMVACRAEIEIGFRANVSAFNLLLGDTPAAA